MATSRWHASLILIFATLATARSLCAVDRLEMDFSPPLEADLLEDMNDGRLDRFTLLEASLIAGGIETREDLREHERRFAEINRRMNEDRAEHEDPGDEAASILQWLHQHVLAGRYLPLCTQLDRTLQSGDYNCVTATILYLCLAKPRGLELTAWGEPGHVFCRLDGAVPLTIQTTSTHGVLGRQATSEDPNIPVDATGAGPGCRALSDVQLVAKIYYNRGVALLEHDAFAAALPLLMRAGELDGDDPPARRNTLACLNNWAVSECRAGHFERALQLLAQGQASAPDYPDFLDNEVYVFCSWARHLAAQGQYHQAVEVLDEACRRQPKVPLFRDAQAKIYETWSPPRAAGQTGGPR